MFFAAGIGITPFLAMMRELKKQGKSFELHYASPSREMCAFFADLITMYPRQVHFYFSSEKNRMSPKIMENQYIGTHVYFCGSAQMMKEYAAEARKYGYPAKNIHYEWFETQHTGPLNAFQVKLGRSGKILEVPENESLLNTLLACGVEIPYACKIGGCGSCQIDVVDGEVDHRDSFLNDEERVAKKVIIACVSRAQKGIVVLDL
nr:iron-sulfur cluster-binding domain-containing protein [Paenibacillus sediminis]